VNEGRKEERVDTQTGPENRAIVGKKGEEEGMRESRRERDGRW